MKKINFLIATRSFARQRTTTLISIIGLSVGLAGVYILTLYILNELGFDKNLKNSDSVYRVISESEIHNLTYARAPFVLGDHLLSDMPDAALLSRVFNLHNSNIKMDKELIREDAIYCAENDIFKIFEIDVVLGSPDKLLSRPGSIVISESIAQKYFGDNSPLGELLVVENNGELFDMVVEGVYKDLPENSTFRPDMIVPVRMALEQMDMMITSSSSDDIGAEVFENSWSMYIFFTCYVSLPEGYEQEMLEQTLAGYKGLHYDENLGLSLKVQPYSDIYFNSGHITAGADGGDKKTVFIYGAVTLLLLFTTIINYILMCTSSIEKRRKEMGIKILNGADRLSVIGNILLETFAFTFISTLIGLSFTELLLPHISQTLFGKELTINYIENWPFALSIVLILIFVSLLSGLYLAIKLSSGKAYMFIKSSSGSGKSNLFFTASLGSIQLTLSVGLLICTATIFSQIRYFNNADIGFNLKNVISIDVSDETVRARYESLKDEIASHPSVLAVSGSMWAPPTKSNMSMSMKRVDNPEENVNLQGLMVDYNIVEALGLRLLEGDDFSRSKGTGKGNVIINKAAIDALGIEGSPIGVKLSFGTVCGVVEDFHIHSFHNKVPPTLIHFMPPGVRTLLVRFNEGSADDAIAHINSVWDELGFDKSMEYLYLTDALKELYSNEQRFARILSIFSLLTMFIALLGVFGMARLTAERNTKQIGIRKVLGAESKGLIWKFLNHYAIMISVSVVLAVPIATILMQKWMQNFEFHGKINLFVYISAIFITVLVVFVTVARQVYKSANANPVESLRYE